VQIKSLLRDSLLHLLSGLVGEARSSSRDVRSRLSLLVWRFGIGEGALDAANQPKGPEEWKKKRFSSSFSHMKAIQDGKGREESRGKDRTNVSRVSLLSWPSLSPIVEAL
jgi:hypothetical protein